LPFYGQVSEVPIDNRTDCQPWRDLTISVALSENTSQHDLLDTCQGMRPTDLWTA